MRRAAVFGAAVAFLALAAAVPRLLFALAGTVTDARVEVPLDVIGPVEKGIERLIRRPDQPGQLRVAYLGDSMIASHRDEASLPARLRKALAERAGKKRFRVAPIAAPGLGPFDFYFLADHVLAANPDQIVLPINLTVFSAPWRGTFSRPELAGVLPAHRLPQALTLPLQWIGLTADRLLGYFVVVRTAGLPAWTELTRQQARLGAARRSLSHAIGERFGDDADRRFDLGAYRYFGKKYNVPGIQRLTAEGVEDRYGRVLRGLEPDHPALQVLEATLRIFQEAGVDVVVYTNPTNVEHMARVGAARPEGLARSIRSIEQVVEAAGARFVDLHDLLPDEGFRDGAGHFEFGEEGIDGPGLLADRIAPLLIEAAHRRMGAR